MYGRFCTLRSCAAKLRAKRNRMSKEKLLVVIVRITIITYQAAVLLPESLFLMIRTKKVCERYCTYHYF